MSGQSITDRITAAQHSVTGSAVAKTVCKATTHEIMGPKKKHLDCKYLCRRVSTMLRLIKRMYSLEIVWTLAEAYEQTDP